MVNRLTQYILLPVLLLTSICVSAQENLTFHRLDSDNGLPCDETYTVIQDDEGFIWIGTLYGLYRYDGYQVRNIGLGTEISSKEIKCLADDHAGGIWIGTKDGIHHIDKRTMTFKTYRPQEFSNSGVVNCFLCRENGETWVGTDGGLYVYNSRTDSMELRYNENQGSLIPHCSVKSIVEDSNGYIWAGTWDQGLFRYNKKSQEWYKLPKFNESNSAHVVFADGKSLWVGTWGHGLYCLSNPYATNTSLDFNRYVSNTSQPFSGSIIGNYIYSIEENREDRTLWVGTNNGLTIAQISNGTLSDFQNYPGSNADNYAFLGTGVESVFCDHTGLMWMCTTEKGVVSVRHNKSPFRNIDYSRLIGYNTENIPSCITTDQAGSLFVGIKSVGTACVNPADSSNIAVRVVTKELTGKDQTSSDRSIYVMEDGTIATGTLSDGFFLKKRNAPAQNYTTANCPWLHDNCVLSFLEENGNLLIGNWKGLCLLRADGTGTNISEITGNEDFINAQINCILKVSDRNYWMSTMNLGIIHVEGNLFGSTHDIKKLRITFHKGYARLVRLLRSGNGTLWACSRQDGLFRYDAVRDSFVCMNQAYSLPTSIVSDMEEDQQGALWLTTNIGLMKLTFDKSNDKGDSGQPRVRLFTKSDGLQSNYLGRAFITSMPNGDMCLAQTDFITLFSPSVMDMKTESNEARITDIKIFNESATAFDSNGIELQHNQNDLTFEFSTLTYDELQSIRFAYKLEGYDHDWIYAPIGHFSAYYNNLPPGSYTFRLQSADASGMWTESSQQLKVVILQPLYKRWWAICLYLLAAGALASYLLRHYRNIRRQREEVRLAHMQAEQTEELNHKKMQFFTNISHDLMTPLTIISASIDSMNPKEEENVAEMKPVIQANATKLIRMIQQILQFRKVESGNLNLQVSQRDLVRFCRKEVESITPLMRSKNIQLLFTSNVEEYKCWFDPDAIDKILYNLLSNAAKYSNTEDGKVELKLHCGKTTEIRVSDNGKGIPEEKRKDLFKRFYEGEHRKFNTYGTGIGLSLARDLIQLHHGTIAFESAEGEGTTFTITFPTTDDAYAIDEKDDTVYEEPLDAADESADVDETLVQKLEQESNTSGGAVSDAESAIPNILLVEDNTELLSVIQRVLSEHYHVVTAQNGKEALECMRSANNDIQMIVSDIMMPEMDGLELTRIIKSDIEISHIPVLLLTAKRTDEDKTVAYRLGADAYLTKPFSMELLIARIENLLHRRREAAAHIEERISQSLMDSSLALRIEADKLDITDLDAAFVKRCKELVEKHIDDVEFAQVQFAEELCVSKSTLYKKLKALTGMNTPAFIRSIRMNTARSLLMRNPHIRMSELAYAVGYNDPKYFTQCFKKDFGMLPSEYVSSQRKSGGTPAHPAGADV